MAFDNLNQTNNKVQVSNGIASLPYNINSDEPVGDFKLKGTYLQNDLYQESSAEVDFKTRKGTTITVENSRGNYNEAVTLTAHVYYNGSTPVPSGQVQFKVAGSIVGTGSVTNGTATYTIDPLTEGYTTGSEITANYLGDSTYGVSETTIAGTLNIRETPTVVLQNVIGSRGENATIPVSVEDVDGESIVSGSVTLYVNNTETDTRTLSSGQASFTYSVPANATAGQNLIKVVYTQSDDYTTAEASAYLLVRYDTSIAVSNLSGNPSENVTLTATVTDEFDNPVTEGKVNITVGSDTFNNLSVGNDGKATCTYPIPSDATGTITYSASYIQNDTYEDCSTANDGVITIRKTVNITVTPVTANLGDTVTLQATVVDSGTQQNISVGEVEFEIEQTSSP